MWYIRGHILHFINLWLGIPVFPPQFTEFIYIIQGRINKVQVHWSKAKHHQYFSCPLNLLFFKDYLSSENILKVFLSMNPLLKILLFNTGVILKITT